MLGKKPYCPKYGKLEDFQTHFLKAKITAQMRRIYVTAPTAGAAESADSP
jgi:hypothetical protein